MNALAIDSGEGGLAISQKDKHVRSTTAIDRALQEIKDKTDLSIRLVAVGQAKYRRVLSLAFEIKEKRRKSKSNGSGATNF